VRPWNWPSGQEDDAVHRLEQRHGMPRPVARVLTRRGLDDEDLLAEFLNPRLGRLLDPMSLLDMDRAVARTWAAVDAGEGIFVHGDYDVDGITGTAFLTRVLRAAGARVTPYVPNRSDGYGLGEPGLAEAARIGAKVLITVDTGVRAVAEVDRARDLGLDVIVLDHHELGETLPRATAVVNPLRGEPGNPFRSLAAVGVAAKFMHAMASVRPGDALREAYRQALQLVALGTIADVVPLTGENRILVSHGLVQLARSQWAGIQALKATARLTASRISATDVAFFVAPRLNAAGRMGEAADALALLLADDPVEAFTLAERLESLNHARRQAEQAVVADALDRLGSEPPPAIVLWSDTWPLGVIGIAASRLQDRFARPVLLVSMDGERGRGSGRSSRAFPLPAALAACDDLLLEHGGHAEAAGFGIRREQLEAFRERVESLAAAANLESDPVPLDVDAQVTVEDLDEDLVQWMERLSPFGKGNPEPLFGARGLVLAGDPTRVGKRHLSLSFARGSEQLKGIAFNQGYRLNDLARGARVDAVFHASFDAWRGRRRVQLVVRDLRVP